MRGSKNMKQSQLQAYSVFQHLIFGAWKRLPLGRGEVIKNGRFFQIVNHRIQVSFLDKMIDGVRQFHEQDLEVKKQYSTHDVTRKCQIEAILVCIKQMQLAGGIQFMLPWLLTPPNPQELSCCRMRDID